MKAIILSAGQGSRLLPHTQEIPKCLLPVYGQTSILGWQLAELEKVGMTQVDIVTGFHADKVEAELDAMPIGVRTIYNPFHEVADNLGSAWLARNEMDDDFILINGDTLFNADVPRSLLETAGEGITVTVARKDIFDDDDMRVVESGGRLLEVGKRLQGTDVNAESIGMIAFLGSGAGLFRDRLDAWMRTRQALKHHYLSVIDDLARTERIAVAEASQNDWCEVDFPKDLENARAMVASWNTPVERRACAS